ncbi:MAG: hypothetical protein COU06_00315 [Candidatus Harrisonbacteria bacterium CG10_big_fil_rev_8_21_14_0_10_38_8]|uniref:Cell division protein FtsL n=1 Tax=Candidatus Harrisonbacteria bacterium CG10_big_fil_rev_8_21_14_0_10_38_8 TaxID=1974582 RepID=A0A2M6WKU4_9BACT|nr:MAG: hypothetical protein COU06_00315 [Candidatus Harrisonbacteria bacterium CG10_big_fil_rev_8_21_14_0_10_38_8]
MTINIKNKNNHIVTLNKILALGVVIVFLTTIWLYAQVISKRNLVNEYKSTTDNLELTNLDYKNSIYQLTDSENLITTADKLGLVKENNPDYLRVGREDNSRLVTSR